jgi:hypothetical protein
LKPETPLGVAASATRNPPSTRRTHAVFLGALLILNAAIKFPLWVQSPQTFTDSSGYLVPALRLLDRREYGSQENGFRTPTYPLFLAAILAPFNHGELSTCRNAREPACLGGVQDTPGALANLRVIAAVQIVLGMLTLVFVYAFAWQAVHNAWVAALGALTYPIDLSTGYWEISLLSDTLTIFLVALAAYLTVIAATAPRHRLAWHLALGLVLSALALCHSTFLLYASVPAAFLFVWERQSGSALTPTLSLEGRGSLSPLPSRERVGVRVGLVLVIPALLVLAWSARNWRVDGYFTPSSLAGYNLTQMVGPFMERAPAAYRDLADIYVKYRAERLAVRGSHSGTVFFAYRDMLDERGITWADLSRVLAGMSTQMILENPVDYLRVAGESFLRFWKFGLGRQNPVLPISFDWVKWFLDSRVHEALMVLFFISPLALLLARRSDPLWGSHTFWIWFALATVWYAALFSSAFNFGDNERYRAHVARLQYSTIILTGWYLAGQLYLRKARSLPGVGAGGVD